MTGLKKIYSEEFDLTISDIGLQNYGDTVATIDSTFKVSGPSSLKLVAGSTAYQEVFVGGPGITPGTHLIVTAWTYCTAAVANGNGPGLYIDFKDSGFGYVSGIYDVKQVGSDVGGIPANTWVKQIVRGKVDPGAVNTTPKLGWQPTTAGETLWYDEMRWYVVVDERQSARPRRIAPIARASSW